MKKGDRITGNVTLLSPKGDGIAFVDGWEVLIPGAVPGDTIEAFVRKKRRGRVEASLVRLLESTCAREEPRCTHFGICGGCRWQDIAYDDQLQVKEDMVRNLLKEVPAREFKEIVPSRDQFFYRNKMEFSFGCGPEGELHVGLHHLGRYNRIFDLEACFLQSEKSNRVVQLIREFAAEAGLPPYDLREHKGLLRFLVIREGKSTGQLMVDLVVANYPDSGVDEVVERILEALPEITTFIVTLHTGKAQVSSGERQFVIKGEGRIVEHCLGLEFDISSKSFFQTNTRQASALYECVSNAAGVAEASNVLDLYCGTGGIGLHLARTARSLVGIEEVAEAVADARANAIGNGLTNCEFMTGRTEDILNLLLSKECRFDVVVSDPPRAGMHDTAIGALIELASPIVVYVSCNAESLGRDSSHLVRAGYEVDSIQPLDLFPHTPHCEVVMVLKRDR